MINRSWVVLELSSKGEREAKEGNLTSLLSSKSRIKRADIFCPYIRVGQSAPVCLVEGYVFITNGYPSSDYWDLKETGLIRSILSGIDEKSGMVSKGTVSDRELKAMVSKADALGGKYKEGDRVFIKSGVFSGLEGTVVGIEKPSGAVKSKTSDMEEFGRDIISSHLSSYSILVEFRSAEVIISLDCFSIEGA